MKKKQPIIIQKNLQSGKIHQFDSRNNNNHNSSSNRALMDKNTQKQSRKLLSHQKLPSNKSKRSPSKSSKQSRQMGSSIGKHQRQKSYKKKSQSVKGSKQSIKDKKQSVKGSKQSIKVSKKSIKYRNSQQQNSIRSQRKNIYTTKQRQGKKLKKKKSKYTDRQQSQNQIYNNQQRSITSITQSIKSQANRLDVDKLVEQISGDQFNNLHRLKLHILNFIFRNRIIRDQQYDKLYQLMVEKFPDKQELFRSILFQIVSSLDN